MGHRTIRHTITRNGIYYVRFRLPGNKYFRKFLETDSHTQAQLLMSFASPVIPLVQRGTIQPDHFGKRLSEYGNTLHTSLLTVSRSAVPVFPLHSNWNWQKHFDCMKKAYAENKFHLNLHD